MNPDGSVTPAALALASPVSADGHVIADWAEDTLYPLDKE